MKLDKSGRKVLLNTTRVAKPNDPKLSDSGVRRGTCMVGGKAVAEAGAVTHGAVRCSAWLGVAALFICGFIVCSRFVPGDALNIRRRFESGVNRLDSFG